MTGVDWVIVVFTAVLALYGWRRGLVVGGLTLVGFVVGAYVGTRVAPLILHRGARSPYAPLSSLVGAVLGGGLLASLAERFASQARDAIALPGLRMLDGLLGAVLTACVALGMVWIVGAVALQSPSPGTLGRDARRSTILADLNSVLPPSGPILDALARLDPLPDVQGPVADVAAPPRGIGRRAGVRAAARSVVRVTGTACGLGVEGSGWVAPGGLVVTNAHVVAGEHDTSVQAGGVGVSRAAIVLTFDVHDDVAVLRVPGLALPQLRFARRSPSGTAAAILGYPLDGGYHAESGRLGQTSGVVTQDAYGNGHVLRSLTALRGRVRPGNSGGPVVNGGGEVLATVFAAVTTSGHPGGFAVPNRIVSRQLGAARRSAGVGTGHCSA